jgi:hypothetical protein
MPMLSMKERWLLARMTGPVSGTFSRPVTWGRKSTKTSGRSTKRASR